MSTLCSSIFCLSERAPLAFASGPRGFWEIIFILLCIRSVCLPGMTLGLSRPQELSCLCMPVPSHMYHKFISLLGCCFRALKAIGSTRASLQKAFDVLAHVSFWLRHLERIPPICYSGSGSPRRSAPSCFALSACACRASSQCLPPAILDLTGGCLLALVYFFGASHTISCATQAKLVLQILATL